MKNRLSQFVAALAVVALSLVVVGCRTTTPFPTVNSTWRTQTGQLLYAKAGERTVIGDVVVSTSGANEFQLDFRTGPGIPLVKLWRSGERARVEGLLARGTWEGAVKAAPARLAGWIAVTDRFPRRRVADRLELESAASQERFVFSFGE